MNALEASMPGTLHGGAWLPRARPGWVGAVVVGHLVAGWGLLQGTTMREVVVDMAPLMVKLVNASPEPAPVLPPPARPVALPSPPPLPVPVIALAPTAEPTPSISVAPPPAEQAQTPAEAAPAPAPSPAPSLVRTIPTSAVAYLEPPAPVYPRASRRQGEQGEVLVKVEIGADGRAGQVLLARSSGFARLDEAALAAVRAARFKPYTENGVARVVWTTVPIQFELAR